MGHSFSYGVIEGFFGRSWEWDTRVEYARFLSEYGFQFYIYAPKGDPYLRRRWREDWPKDERVQLVRMAEAYSNEGVSWGMGLSPFEAYLDFDGDAKRALEQKVESINQFSPDILCLLLDDMRGDFPALAHAQLEILNTVVDCSNASRFVLCPTYYSFDPILEKLFGEMPKDYWKDLGRLLDPAVEIFWTGMEVCSESYEASHLKEVAERLGRKPFIWDNYPVNDGAKRSRHLYLKAYENRPWKLAEWTSGHAVNPMNQAHLSKIPLHSLSTSYTMKSNYDAESALSGAIDSICDDALGEAIRNDVGTFQEIGLDGLEAEVKQSLIKKYRNFANPMANELVAWLRDEYAFDPACLTE